MARKEPENFYRRQQEEANRIAVKQHRALVDLVRLAKSSNEELRKMRLAFEAFAEAVSDMKIEPFKLQTFTAARAEAERTVKIAEGEHPPPLFDVKAFKEALDRGEAPVVPEGEPYPEVHIEPDHSKKRVETHAGRAFEAFAEAVASPDERTAPPLVVVDEAEADTLDSAIKAALNADGELVNELPMQPATGVPVKLGGEVVGTADIFEDGTASIHFNDLMEIPSRHGELDLSWKHELADEEAEKLEEVMGEGGGDLDAMFACPSDCALDHEHIAAHGSDPAFWHEPEEECADVSEARRTPQGYAVGGYTRVSAMPFANPGVLCGTAEHLQHMRDLRLIAEDIITHETDVRLDIDRSQGRE